METILLLIILGFVCLVAYLWKKIRETESQLNTIRGELRLKKGYITKAEIDAKRVEICRYNFITTDELDKEVDRIIAQSEIVCPKCQNESGNIIRGGTYKCCNCGNRWTDEKLQFRLSYMKTYVKEKCKGNKHIWRSIGGRRCPQDYENCSQTVYECKMCGSIDFGEEGGPAWEDCEDCDLWKI